MTFLRHSIFPALFSGSMLLAGCVGDSSDSPLGRAEEPVVVCAKGATVEGVDVSEWQGGSIDWNAVKSSGRAFGIARVSYGTGHIDATFPGNWSGMKSAGLVRGAYQWFRPAQDPIAQADIVVARVGKLGPGDLPVTADVEETQGVSGATIAAQLHAWVDRIEAGTGKKPIIYSGKYFWNDNVGSGDFVGLPLWIPAYGPTCPDLPNPWSDWRFFQYSDKGSVPGIPGGVDSDKFNGNLAELMAFAGESLNAPPQGWLDEVSCDRIGGWAQDPDTKTTAIDVHLYFDGPAGDPKATARASHANVNRPDLCTAIGSCEHGYEMAPPLSLFDGKPHEVHAYAIDSSGKGPNPELEGSPKTLTCARPKLPEGVRRWVPNPTVLAAWKLDPFMDMVTFDQATIDAIDKGRDVPDAPALISTDDPALGVMLVDGNYHRHVQDPASMDAWRFSFADVKKASAADFAKLAESLPWRERPFLAKGDGPEVYLLDDRTEAKPATPAPPPSGDDAGTNDAGPVTSANDSPPAEANAESAGSCSAAHARSSASRDPAGGALLFGLVALLTRRRRTR
jgi:GH25 family lysozyme M1 (1,4-beta-N-acetylmuramidase)